MGITNNFGTERDIDLELLSGGKKGYTTMLARKIRDLQLSSTVDKGQKSDEFQLRSFFHSYQRVILDFLVYIEKYNKNYSQYSQKVFQYKDFFDYHREDLKSGEMSMEEFLSKIEEHEKEQIQRSKLEVRSSTLGILFNG